MPPSPELEISPASAQHASGLKQLFASNGYGCYCRLWHFDGTAREWLARCSQRPEENAAECEQALVAGSPEMTGMVASRGDEIVGWLKLAPAEVAGKLYGQRLYKDLPCFSGDRRGIYCVGCLLVREDQRHRGVARALLTGAIEHAQRSGARALEALPRSDRDAADVSLMMGPTQLFLDAGFQVVHDFEPYPVLRLELARPAS
jgi:GNAT superfamily N-acetyltransferase